MYYSQLGQDKWVLEQMEGPGFFVEVGAYDGVKDSNTLALENRGWEGLLIEGDPKRAAKCARNRASLTHNVCVGDGTPGELYVAGVWSGLKGKCRSNIEAEHVRRNNPTIPVITVPLISIISSNIDYLSIDTEGNEYEILRDFVLAGGQFKLLTIEVGSVQSDLGKICDLLIPRGYRLDKITKWDAFFYHV
jgi:FkbM family methyltransferase